MKRNKIDTDHLADKIDAERRRKVMEEARRRVQRRGFPLSYASIVVPEGIVRFRVDKP